MVRAFRVLDRSILGWRLLTPVLAVGLLFSVDVAAPTDVAAGGDSGVASIRARQVRAEATMLRADKQIRQLKKQRSHGAKRLTRSKAKLERRIERRNRVQLRSGRIEGRLSRALQILERTLRVRPNPSGRQVADKPALRKRVAKLDRRLDRMDKAVRKSERRVDRARKQKQRSSRKVSRARIASRVAARERAEDKLSSRITQMLARSKQRASSGPASSQRKGFRAPARGRTSQPYGCTGYGANKRRGSCRHFHDGIDIATARGTRVRASADGYVAYVGRNPWDSGRRAYVVIIGHARGYETIYAHLKPIRKTKAGQRVKRGQVIGVVGMTGHTTGPHVHWEVSRDFRTQNPLRAGR